MVRVEIPDRVCWALTHSYTRPEPDLYVAIVAWCREQNYPYPFPAVCVRPGTARATMDFADPDMALAFKLRWC